MSRVSAQQALLKGGERRAVFQSLYLIASLGVLDFPRDFTLLSARKIKYCYVESYIQCERLKTKAKQNTKISPHENNRHMLNFIFNKK